MVQQNGDVEKCKRETTYKRHPFLEWFIPEPPSQRYSGEYYLYLRQNETEQALSADATNFLEKVPLALFLS